MGFKYKLRLDNTVGIIDSDYYYDVNGDGFMNAKDSLLILKAFIG